MKQEASSKYMAAVQEKDASTCVQLSPNQPNHLELDDSVPSSSS